MIFISVVIFQLLRRALFSIPDDSLFFWTSDAMENFLCASIAYFLYYFVFKLKHIWKKIGLVSVLIIPLIAMAALKDYRIHLDISFEQTFEYFTSFLGQSLLFYALLYFVNQLEFFTSYKRLEWELSQAKAQLLRNQLHPHFLYNAFNSLYGLSLKNHPETSDYILKLSSMMRYLTDDTPLDKVPLTKELDFIQKYIAIEKMRFGENASIQLTIDGNVNDGKLIAPFVLITLVENAFKHGFYTNTTDAFVNMTLSLKNKELLFTVKNSVLEKQHFQDRRVGKGLDNLRQRLDLLYPRKSSLVIKCSENIYSAQLKITLN